MTTKSDDFVGLSIFEAGATFNHQLVALVGKEHVTTEEFEEGSLATAVATNEEAALTFLDVVVDFVEQIAEGEVGDGDFSFVFFGILLGFLSRSFEDGRIDDEKRCSRNRVGKLSKVYEGGNEEV